MSRFLAVAWTLASSAFTAIGVMAVAMWAMGIGTYAPCPVTPAPMPSVAAPAFRGVITEDMSAWSCRTMGNRVCGEVMVSWGNGGRIA